MQRNVHKGLLALLLTLACLSALMSEGGSQNFTLRNRKIVDYAGREMYFHGTNIVAKRAPYIPSNGAYDEKWSFNSEDI